MLLNLGCGMRRQEGYINVDRFGNPDVFHDLESFPWPWPDNSVSEVLMIHVLEHLGQDAETFRKIIQELFRICRDQAMIKLVVPHPKHDTYLGDPTHVRPITEAAIHLLSRKENIECIQDGAANSCLAIEWNVDFEVSETIYLFDQRWKSRLDSGLISSAELYEATFNYNNVIETLEMKLKVLKS
jgi:hypothetical protein